MTPMFKQRIFALVILLAGLMVGYFIYASEPKISGEAKPWGSAMLSKFPFKLGLDLSGGTHLIYRTDVSKVGTGEIKNSMDALRDVIERRVNLFGVSEPLVQLESGGFAGNEQRLIVELPGITDVNQAVAMIGQTPLLEFKTERPNGPEKDAIIKAVETFQKAKNEGREPEFNPLIFQDPNYIPPEFTGRY